MFGGVITWDDIYLGGGGVFGKLPLGDCLMAMAIQIFVYLFLTLYLDSVFGPDQRNCCFCISKRAMIGRSAQEADEEEEKYVLEERERVEDDEKCNSEGYVVRIRNLRKEYPTKDGAFVAVDNLSMGVKHGECFGMLGPNGAGKTTTINMLCGMFLPTSGKADLYQKDLVDDIKQIQKVMGVCPQHDLLWGSLTGIEHLLFYGRLRGLSGKELDHEVRSPSLFLVLFFFFFFWSLFHGPETNSLSLSVCPQLSLSALKGTQGPGRRVSHVRRQEGVQDVLRWHEAPPVRRLLSHRKAKDCLPGRTFHRPRPRLS